MKIFFSLIICILDFVTVSSQTVSNGKYKSVQDGRKLITQMEYINGKVTGTMVFADGECCTSVFNGTVINKTLTGKQKDNISGLDIKFEAIDNGSSISWEMKGVLLELMYTKEERTVIMTRADANIQTNNTSSAKLDSRLIGSWIYRQISNSSNGNASIYEGLRLTSSGICQRSSKVTVMGETSGSLDDWKGNMNWYVEENYLYIIENGNAMFHGTYIVNSEGMVLVKDGKKKYYTKQ